MALNAVDPARLRSYEEAGSPRSPSRDAVEIERHLSAATALAARGDETLATGARHAAALVAMRLAATPFARDRDHVAAVQALRGTVAAWQAAGRGDLVDLLGAGLRADVERRIAVGLRPRVEGQVGYLDDLDERLAPPPVLGDVAPPDVALYRSVADGADVDVALARSIRVLHDLVALTDAGRGVEGAWWTLAAHTFALCVDRPGSRARRLDRRRALLLLCRTLRRRLPLAAAMVRRRLAMDREAWPAPPAPHETWQ